MADVNSKVGGAEADNMGQSKSKTITDAKAQNGASSGEAPKAETKPEAAAEPKQPDGPFTHEPPQKIVYDDQIFPGMVFELDVIKACKEFEFIEDDVLLETYPRSGTTFSSEVIYLILNGADLEDAKKASIGERVPFMEMGKGERSGIEKLKKMPKPHFIKSHLPVHYFEKSIRQGKTKTIVVNRNAKDTIVSFWNFYKILPMVGCLDCTFEQFLDLVYTKQTCWGDWWDYTLGWQKVKDLPNVLMVYYEDLKQKPVPEIRRMADFLGKPLTEEQVQTIATHTSFEKMKQNPSTNYQDFAKKGIFDFSKGKFMRKGEVGSWKEAFTVAQNERFDAYYAEMMKDSDMKFTYE